MNRIYIALLVALFSLGSVLSCSTRGPGKVEGVGPDASGGSSDASETVVVIEPGTLEPRETAEVPNRDEGSAADASVDDGRGVEAAFDAGPLSDVTPSPDVAGESVVADAGSPPDVAPRPDVVRPPDTRPKVCPTYQVRHLQASMEHFDPSAQRNASIDAAFAAGADTISWTEIESLDMIKYIQSKNKTWGTFWPSGKPEAVAKNAVPISWLKSTWTFVKGNSWFASPGMAGVSPSRFVTRVWLRHNKGGKVQSRVAHHSVSGVDGAGKDPVQWRRDQHAKNIAKFKEVMLLDSVPVIGSADFNTTRLKNLLGSKFLYDVPGSGGSHGSRLIDWIVRLPNQELKVTNEAFVSLKFSDHRGVKARYDYKPPCK